MEQTSGVKPIKKKPENGEQNQEEEEMSWIGQYKVSNWETEDTSVLFGRQYVVLFLELKVVSVSIVLPSLLAYMVHIIFQGNYLLD